MAGLLITSAVIITQWSQNILRLGFENVWPTLAVVLALVVVVTAVFWLIVKAPEKANLATALFCVYVFYAPIFIGITGLSYPIKVALHLVVIAGFVLLYRAFPKTQDKRQKFSTNLNLLGLFLFFVAAVPVVIKVIGLENTRSNASDAFAELDGTASADSPDVWHIIFDRYASDATLSKHYDYDNSSFTRALRERGFAVADNAFSNYQRTGHSVASTLNGSLLDPLAKPMADQQDDWVPLYRSMRDGAAIKQFNRMGYETIFAGSWWEPTRFSATASQSIQIRAMPQLARLLIDNSAIGFWLRKASVPYLQGRADQCYRAKEKFRQLENLARSNEQKLVFAHFLVPHPPFVLEADGSCRTRSEAIASGRRDNYVRQVQFANANALRLIDAILAGTRPAVIVLHSDEGPWPEPYVGNEHGLGTDPVPVPWADLPAVKMQEKFGILLALREPDGMPPTTMPTSPVQIYPAILRDHFASERALPQSEHKVFLSDQDLYRFKDVGAKLSASSATTAASNTTP